MPVNAVYGWTMSLSSSGARYGYSQSAEFALPPASTHATLILSSYREIDDQAYALQGIYRVDYIDSGTLGVKASKDLEHARLPHKIDLKSGAFVVIEMPKAPRKPASKKAKLPGVPRKAKAKTRKR
jgi:hypothetical protein